MTIEKAKHCKTSIIMLSFMLLLLFTVFINYLSIKTFEDMRIKSLVSLDSLLFLLLGMLLLGLTAYLVVCLSQYKVGKLFAGYTLLIGLSVALAPCSPLNPIIDFIGTTLALLGSLLLFQTLGQLTLLHKKPLFYLFRSLLFVCMVFGTVIQLLQYNGSHPVWMAFLSEEYVNISILLCAIGSLVTMSVHYNKSNTHSRKQIKTLIAGMAGGVMIFLLVYFMPYVSFIHTTSDIPITFEIAIEPASILIYNLPLLLFSGVSIAILFMLFKRGFIPNESRLKLWHFIITACYLFGINLFFYIFPVYPTGIFLTLNVLLSAPFILLYGKVMKLSGDGESAEDTYQWNLLEELEQERQQLSVYLHDEVLQSLIAFYRLLQADKTEQYVETKEHLSKMIAQIRGVSHNLYPTIVEDLGLEQSLLLLTDDLKTSYPNRKIISEYRLTEGILPQTLALSFYRIVKELVINAAKHANGTEIRFSLTEDENGYYIRVKDNGQGFSFPDNNALLSVPHMGIYTVKKQIAKLHGQISFHSDKDSGTDYHIFIPAKEGLHNAN